MLDDKTALEIVHKSPLLASLGPTSGLVSCQACKKWMQAQPGQEGKVFLEAAISFLKEHSGHWDMAPSAQPLGGACT